MASVTPTAQTAATCQRSRSAPVSTAVATAPVPNSTMTNVPSTSPRMAALRLGNWEFLLRAAGLHGKQGQGLPGEALAGSIHVEVQIVDLPAEAVRVRDPELVRVGVAAGHADLFVDGKSRCFDPDQM